MTWGPATFVVMLAVGVLLVLGALLASFSKRRRTRLPRDKYTCVSCGHRNVASAKYCAQCGSKLDFSNS